MTEKHDSQTEHPRRAFWHEIVCPTAKGLEQFFWNLAWFLVIVFLLFGSLLFA